MKIVPNQAQLEALKSIRQERKKGSLKYLVVMPSGIGKTYLSAFETENFDGRVLYLAHRNEIIHQAISSFRDIHGLTGDDFGVHDAKSKNVNKKFIFATVQSLGRRCNLKKIPKNHFQYIILDEYHHVSATSYQRVLGYFDFNQLLGMTATPHRLDGKDIMKDVNSNVPFKMGIKEGIKQRFLCPFYYVALWDDVDYSDIKWHGHTYRERDLDKKLLIKRRDDQILREFKDKMKKRQTIAFCVSVKHVERLVKQFNKNKIKSVGVTYKTRVEARRKIIRQFRTGQYQVLFTRDIFNEGVDFPEVEGLLFLRPTFSKTTFLQQLGRGLRTRKGKKDVKVLDFIGNYVNAYMIREWLQEIIPRQGSRKGKPVYKHILPMVNFDVRVIDLFDRQETGMRTKENLINEYFKVKEKLKKAPTAHQIAKHGRFGLDSYKARWGSWLNFRILVGDNTTHITREQIKKQFKEFYKRHGRPPTTRDLKKHKMYSDNTIRKVFGSYARCIASLGWQPKKHTKLDINKKVLIGDFKRLKKELGRVPFLAELEKELPYGFSTALEVYFKDRGYGKFLKQMGEKPTPKPKESYIKKSKRAKWLKENK